MLKMIFRQKYFPNIQFLGKKIYKEKHLQFKTFKIFILCKFLVNNSLYKKNKLNTLSDGNECFSVNSSSYDIWRDLTLDMHGILHSSVQVITWIVKLPKCHKVPLG